MLARMEGILTSNEALTMHWYALARSVELQGTPRAARLLGRDIVLWRGVQGEVIAAPDRCPHRESPLSLGTVKDGCLVCPYHGWVFGHEGRCVLVPSAGDGVPPPPRAHLATYHAAERYGLVWVCIGQPAAGIPDVEQDHDPAFRRINTPIDVWRTSATRMTDNFLDITHFPFVHTATFGNTQDTRVPNVELADLDDRFHGYRYEVIANNRSVGAIASGQDTAVVHRTMSSGFALPFTVRSTITYDTGLQHVLLLLSTPIDDVTSYFTFVVWRNDDFARSAEEIVRFDLAIGAEDKLMLERVPGVLPLDQTTLVSVQADKCSVEWRRRLTALMSAN
jgi:phenylpropionate dioxygenase-like ring-hydroxylating dioxygenase large terminal subunit